MISNTLGYIFECREDQHNAIGIMESYKLMYKGEDMRVSFVLTVDSHGKIVMPSNMNKSLGFRPLTEMCETVADVENFAKSNKPYFSVLGEFSLVVAGTIIFDKNTKTLRSTDGVSFYLPKTVSHNVKGVVDSNGVQQPALICERISTDKGLNCFTVSPEIYASYMANFLKCIKVEALEDRGSFLSSIIL